MDEAAADRQPASIQHLKQRIRRIREARISGDGARPYAQLTLVRHGQSEWNLANRFTGWVDVDLTERGITEARRAGRMLAEARLTHDLVVTSTLRRAIRTACLCLSGTDQCWVPMAKDVRLNEQHSGQLTGHNKRELAERHGVDQVMKWRRTYDCPPPALPSEDPFHRALCSDERYRYVTVPSTESLELTAARVESVWDETIAPALRDGQNVMVVSHGNTLRALCKLIDGVSAADSFHLDLPTACPVVYEFADAALNHREVHGFWGSSDAPRHGRFLVDAKLVAKAQDAMRLQCLQNIAVSTVSSEGEDKVSICDAWTSEKATDGVALDSEGRSYKVRERPPSYFALESERIADDAKKELRGMLSRLERMSLDEHRQLSMAVGEEGAGTPSRANGASEGTGVEGDVAAAGSVAATASRGVPAVSLIIVRHGYSEYNAENRFTGWADVELSNRGREEARFAGSLLREAGCERLEGVFTSYLKRAVKTAWLMLDELELQWVPVQCDWRLNERHYGLLQGQPKLECTERYGVKQVHKWRRGIDHPPPPWTPEQRASLLDRRYDDVDVPSSESLADCTARLAPFLEEELWPALRAAVDRAVAERADRAAAPAPSEGDAATARPAGVPAFVITSSENLIRALVTELDGVAPDQVPLLDIPYATPLVYQFDSNLRPLRSPLASAPLRHGYYLGDAQRIRDVQTAIRQSIVLDDKPESCDVSMQDVAALRGRDIDDEAGDDEGEGEDCDGCFAFEDDLTLASWRC